MTGNFQEGVDAGLDDDEGHAVTAYGCCHSPTGDGHRPQCKNYRGKAVTTPQTTEPCSPAIEAAIEQLVLAVAFNCVGPERIVATVDDTRAALRSAINAEVAAARQLDITCPLCADNARDFALHTGHFPNCPAYQEQVGDIS